MFLENTINHSKQSGWMEVICGSMFSGKTEELIRRLRRAEMAGQHVEIFKPKMDTRYAEEDIITYSGLNLNPTVDNIFYRRIIHFTYGSISLFINIFILYNFICKFKKIFKTPKENK